MAKRFDYASTGPDAGLVTVSGYGSPRIAHIHRAEDCDDEKWADFKRAVLELQSRPTGTAERLTRFVEAHQGESDSLAVVVHGGERGVLSDRDGFFLTLGDLRSLLGT